MRADKKHRPYSKHLDKLYPHFCFRCEITLKFEHFYNANAPRYAFKNPIADNYTSNFSVKEYKKFKRMWKSPYVEFYCCICVKSNKFNSFTY